MIYIAWAGLYEGGSDRSYYDVLLPRLTEEITLAKPAQHVTIATTPVIELGRNGREVEKVAREVCSNKQQIDLLFIHADAGDVGRPNVHKKDHWLIARPHRNAVSGIQPAVSSSCPGMKQRHGSCQIPKLL